MINDEATTTNDVELLAPARARLDQIDGEVLDLLVERMRVCLAVADLKADHDIPMMQPGRVSHVLRRAEERARSTGLDPDYLTDVYRRVIDATCAAEDVRIAERAGKSA
jgi:chorismate mutase-like protein